MRASEHWHKASDGKELFYRRFLPESAPRAVVQIVHGLVEHSARYARVAETLTAQGYAVYVDDHRGHGQTGKKVDELGWFDGGVARVLTDLVELMDVAKKDFPGLPYCLFGHSLGSLLSQRLIQTHGDRLSAVVLSGSSGKPPPLALVGLGIARLEILRNGTRGTSKLAKALSFDAWNKQFKASGNTPFEWLSRDRAEVDKYAADPFCGFDSSNEAWLQILQHIFEIAKAENRAQIPKQLPIYVFSGSDDMVSNRTKELMELLSGYEKVGLRDVTLKIYPGGRHEMLNETNRDEVTRDLVGWLSKKLAA
jgi:alpha-beta hydrolase superfamily lysophospholipase